jgi:chemotaxis protein CheY-P-specific phosphatase CheC
MAYQAFLNNRSMQQDLQQQFANITTEADQTGLEELNSFNQMKEAGLVSMQEQGTEREGMGEGALFLGSSSLFGAKFGEAQESLGSLVNQGIKSGVSNVKNFIGDNIKEAYQNVKDTVTGKIADLRQSAEDTASALKSEGQDMITSAMTKGKDLSQGLEQSYSSSVENLGDNLLGQFGTREMASRSGSSLVSQVDLLNADPEISMALSNMGQTPELSSIPEFSTASDTGTFITPDMGTEMTQFQTYAKLPESNYITDELDTSGKPAVPTTTEPGDSLAETAKITEAAPAEAAPLAEEAAAGTGEAIADTVAASTAEIPVLDVLTGVAALGFGLFSLFDKPHTPTPPPPPLETVAPISQSIATVQSGV